MTTAAEVFGVGLAAGSLRLEGSRRGELPVQEWASARVAGDEELVSRCHGPTLDVGCGPGRLVAALLRRGVPALGIDVSGAAVRLARRRGAAVLQRDVFDPVPREAGWRHLLLADGNIGIGGDPVRLLARCRELLAPDGGVLLDLQGSGPRMRTERVRLRAGGLVSDWFAWASVPTGALPAIAAATGFAVAGVWRSGPRWQAELRVATRWEVVPRGPR